MDALSVLKRLAQGHLIEELEAALALTASEVVETGKPGVVSVTFKVSNAGQGEAMVVIEESIKRRAPVRAPRGGFLYAVDGALHADDPRQTRLPWREVDRETGEIRDRAPVTDSIKEIAR